MAEEQMLDEVTAPDGSKRRLGNKLPNRSSTHSWPVFAADPTKAKLIPRGEWDALLANYDSLNDFDPAVPYVHDQGTVGQCNADATASLIEFTRYRQSLPSVKLSAADLYHRINDGVDRGSLLEDAIREVMDRGIGTADTSGLRWKNGEFKGPAPAAERARHKVIEAYLCPSFDHCFSAVLQGFGLVSGILWYDSYTPDADGWLPPPGGRSGGHAILGYKPARRGSKYGIWHCNSWGTGFGRNGRFVIPESAYNGPIGGWWAARAVIDEGV